MNDREALEFCRDPAHLEPAGPALRRKGPRKTAMAAVRFDPAVIDAVKRLTEGSEMTVSSWIRKLVAAEIAEPETVDFALDDGTVVQLPADAVRAISGRLMPLLWVQDSVTLTFGKPAVRPQGLIPGSGRMGEPKTLGSALSGPARTFSCPHLSIGNVTSASCGQCGSLKAAA